MTSDLTDSLVIRPLDRRDVISDFGQGCFLRPELKVFHFQDYSSLLRSGDFFLEGKGRQWVWIRVQLFICICDLQACVVNRSDLFCVLPKLSCAWNRRATSDRSTLSSLTMAACAFSTTNRSLAPSTEGLPPTPFDVVQQAVGPPRRSFSAQST